VIINAHEMHFEVLNRRVKESEDRDIRIDGCLGQRYIGSGTAGKIIDIHGTPGNALGAYLNGSQITVYGNAQDATGDTMNDGAILIHGSSGDATGYAMRGGKIFVRDNIGYRAGIHMKAYRDKNPLLIAGGNAGSFLGEYQAGGTIIVLGLQTEGRTPVGFFCGTGMHGGRIYLRCERLTNDMPRQVVAARAADADLAVIENDLSDFCALFSISAAEVYQKPFYLLTPDTKNPYKQLYTYH
jgi:glutamate synthase domain-containing protein 3